MNKYYATDFPHQIIYSISEIVDLTISNTNYIDYRIIFYNLEKPVCKKLFNNYVSMWRMEMLLKRGVYEGKTQLPINNLIVWALL